MYMVMCVLDNCDLLDALLDAWEAAGVSGVTIFESTGVQRRRAKRKRIPVRFPFEQGPFHCLEDHYTLLSVVESADLVDKCAKATEKIVGDLTNPNTGIFAAWPLTIVYGLPKKRYSAQEG